MLAGRDPESGGQFRAAVEFRVYPGETIPDFHEPLIADIAVEGLSRQPEALALQSLPLLTVKSHVASAVRALRRGQHTHAPVCREVERDVDYCEAQAGIRI